MSNVSMNIFIDTEGVMKILSVSKSSAYKIIRELNKDLSSQGFYTVKGKVSKKFFNEKFYGVLG